MKTVGLFSAVGVLHVKDTTLQTIATSMWGEGLTIATELAQQKSDFILGALLLFFSFLVQVVSKLVPQEIASLAVAPSQLSGVVLVSACQPSFCARSTFHGISTVENQCAS
jgi:hypothetical protein